MVLLYVEKIKGNRRGEIQLWLEEKVDRDTDFYTCMVSERNTDYVLMLEDWHGSPNDKNLHLTGDVVFVSLFLLLCVYAHMLVSPRITSLWGGPTSTCLGR